MLHNVDLVIIVMLFAKVFLRQFSRNIVKLLNFNGDLGYKQKSANWSTKGVGGKHAPDKTIKKKYNLNMEKLVNIDSSHQPLWQSLSDGSIDINNKNKMIS